MSLSKAAQAELDQIRQKYGVVAPRMVLNFARDEDTELHDHFNWDDGDAAERYRLLQAGQLIRAYVVVRSEDQPPIRGLVSLIQDRDYRAKEIGNGPRRHIDDVMDDEDMRANLLETALMELRAFKRKYASLQELSSVWNALEKVEAIKLPARQTEERVSA